MDLLQAALRDSAPELRRVAARALSRRGALGALALWTTGPSIAKAALIASTAQGSSIYPWLPACLPA